VTNAGRTVGAPQRKLCAQEPSTVLMVTQRDGERTFWQGRICGPRLVLGARR